MTHHTVPNVVGGIVVVGGLITFIRFKNRHSLLVTSVLGMGLISGGVLLGQGNIAGHYIVIGSGTLLAVSGLCTITGTLLKLSLVAIGTSVASYHILKLLNNQ
mmetsp:Transcript_51522/g.78216  ORF Transcript_51522/g.78216 Transcript_51522/m.78216 type:complete len:103 (-) Transcript_51522:78-386(-)